MPLILNTQCKTCGTERPPAGATFCRTCGRRYGWTETPAGRWRGGLVVGAVALAVAGLAMAGLFFVARPTVMARPTEIAVRTVPAIAPVPALPMPTVPTPTPSADVTPALSPTVPTRPGDVDLMTDPLSLYAGGPSADRLTIRGLRLGLALADVPVALLDDSAPDHLRDVGGNLYAVDGGRISEVHVFDRDLLGRWPIDGTHALLARLGEPADTFDDGNVRTYRYPDRGIHVRWDTAAGRIVEVVLVRPIRW